MRAGKRYWARQKLDKENRLLRAAAKKYYPKGILRAVRQALGIRAADMARQLKVNPSVLFRLEKSEISRTISLKSMERVAQAMGCEVIYGIVPNNGKTLEELAIRRLMGKELEEG
jgi:transcriptional regulator with XRE-family HTH domain